MLHQQKIDIPCQLQFRKLSIKSAKWEIGVGMSGVCFYDFVSFNQEKKKKNRTCTFNWKWCWTWNYFFPFRKLISCTRKKNTLQNIVQHLVCFVWKSFNFIVVVFRCEKSIIGIVWVFGSGRFFIKLVECPKMFFLSFFDKVTLVIGVVWVQRQHIVDN